MENGEEAPPNINTNTNIVKEAMWKGEGAPPNTNTNMCEEVMWKKGRGAAKSRKGDDMRPPLRLHNLNDWETDRGLS